jgi:tetratricopeptide (TPR) repeat protein
MKVYAPGTEIGSYRVLSDPMMGGMGVVYVCHDLANDRAVALKTFKPEYLPDRAARDRFLREGTAWVDLGWHPNIVRCYEVHYIDPTAFLVLELVVKEEGRKDASLRSWLGQPLPLETALAFTLQIARGLAHAARQIPGFVHRDLKPENVLVGKDTLLDTGVNRLRVTDFGLVAILADEGGRLEEEAGPELLGRTHLTHGLVGTPLYMAPEQWTGGPLGVYTDVYALGCILYEMLTGERVVSGRSLTEVKTAHCQGHLRPIPEDLPGAVTSFLTRCLAREGGERYPDWEAVLSALEAACAGQGVALPAPQAAVTSQAEQRNRASSYNAMGLSYLDLGNARVALGYYEKALGIVREIGDRQGKSVALGNLGLAYADLGDARRAIGYYEESLKIAREIGDRGGEGNALGNLGAAYYSLGDARRAIGYYEEDLKIARKIGDQRGEGNALGNLGAAYYSLGDARRAIGYYEAQLTIAREIGDRRGEGTAQSGLGIAYKNLGDARRAIGYYEEALKIAREIGNLRGEGNALGNLGLAYADLGDARRAIGYYEEALKIARETGDRRGEGAALGNLGSAYYSLGDARPAIRYYEESLKIDREIGDRRGESNDLGNLGSAYLNLGNARRAIGYYEESLKIAREIGDRRGEGAALGNLGIAYKNLGDARRAIGYYEESLKIDREIGDRRGEGAVLNNLGLAYAALGDTRRAIGHYEESLKIDREIGDRRGEGAALGNLGLAYAALGDTRRAIGYYEAQLTIARKIGDRMGLANVSGNMALLHMNQGNKAEALHYAQDAVQIFTQIGHLPNAQKVQQIVDRIQGSSPAPATGNPTQAAFEAFQRAGSVQEMQAALATHPMLKDPKVHAAIEQLIREQVPDEAKPAFEQRLALLKQLTQA